MPHPCGSDPKRARLEVVARFDGSRIERVGQALLELQGVLEHPGGCEQGKLGPDRLVPTKPARQVVRIQIEEVIEVSMGDRDGVHVAQTDVTLKVGHRPRPRVQPQREAVLANEIAARRSPGDRPSAPPSQHDQLHPSALHCAGERDVRGPRELSRQEPPSELGEQGGVPR